MKKYLGIVFSLVLAVSLLMVPAAPATAYNYDEYTGAITNAADRLVLLQGTEGEWAFDVTGQPDFVPPESWNIYGVIALGLIDAYEVTGDEAYKTAAKKTADHLKVGSEYYSFDSRFLMEYAVISDDPSYSNSAIVDWEWQKENAPRYASAEAWWNWAIAGGHPAGSVAWQGSDYGLAALAMEDTAWASAMADVLAGHLTDIAADDIYCFIGWGKALELLNAVDSIGYSTEIDALITNLKNSQNDEDGYWGLDPLGNPEGNAQDTAYAIMGLVVAGGADAIEAAEAGADWLVESQDGTGGWIFLVGEDPREISETDSEALQAIKAVLDISSSVSLTAASEAAVIGISVSPTSIGFGAVTSGATVAGPALTVTNTGNVGITVDADIAADTVFNDANDWFYTAALRLNGQFSDLAASPADFGSWIHSDFWGTGPIEVKGTRSVTTELQCPSEIKADTTYTGTVVFWAMQPE